MSRFIDKIANAYVRNIRKWVLCPNCGDKMRANYMTSHWECQKCNYSLDTKNSEGPYVFWFCDECNAFLNNQDGFEIDNEQWICQKCGHGNDISKTAVTNTCKDCGITLDTDAKYGLCGSCRKIRHELWISRLKTGAKVVGILAAVAGFVYIVARSSDYDDSNSYKYASDGDDDDTLRCANCGNDNLETLFDEGDTVYCQVCCHRTRTDTHEDDLVECPYCHFMRDRKAYYCMFCNNTWDTEPFSPEEIEKTRESIIPYISRLKEHIGYKNIL